VSQTQVKSRGRGREVKVGIFVILGIGAVLTALFTLTDAALFRGRYIVSTLVPNAGGIRKGDSVQMRGVNIGRIQKFLIAKEGVTVSLEIEGEYKIPTDSKVELKSIGVLGGMVADVVPGTAPTFLKGGDTLPGGMGAGVFDQMGKLADQSHEVLGRVQALLSEKTVNNVESSTTELNAALKDLAEITKQQKSELAELTTSLRKTAGSVEKATSGPELEASIKRLDTITKNLDAMSATFERTSKSSEAVLARMERGEGTLGRLSKDETLYVNANEAVVNLNKTIQEMKLLTEDIRKQPRRYLKLSFF
jgi:phospholipid/cholesterol/gamma-HCH transport system substrate-binding protein